MDTIRILVIDDNSIARSMLIRMLSSAEDMMVVGETETGGSGILMLEETQPDIILLEADIGKGMELSKIVKEMKSINPDLKIILCVDSYTFDLIIPAADSGVDNFVRKPYDRQSLMRTIREAMR